MCNEQWTSVASEVASADAVATNADAYCDAQQPTQSGGIADDVLCFNLYGIPFVVLRQNN